MALGRTRFQGLANIIRFNWHFYLLALFALVGLVMLYPLFPPSWQPLVVIGASVAFFSLLMSLVASFYVYDCKGLYDLSGLPLQAGDHLLNVNAGFDETSDLLEDAFPDLELTVADFYDPDT